MSANIPAPAEKSRWLNTKSGKIYVYSNGWYTNNDDGLSKVAHDATDFASELVAAPPDLQDFKRLLESWRELGDWAPTNGVAPDMFFMSFLADRDCRFTYNDKNQISGFEGNWEAINAVRSLIADAYREHGPQAAEKLREEIQGPDPDMKRTQKSKAKEPDNITAEERASMEEAHQSTGAYKMLIEDVGEENVEWFQTLDGETIDLLMSLDREDRMQAIRDLRGITTQSMTLCEQTTDAVSTAEDSAAVPANPAEDAESDGVQEPANTGETVEVEAVSDDELAAMAAADIHKREDGIIVDSDGNVLNPAVAFQKLGLMPPTHGQITTPQDLAEYAVKINLLQQFFVDEAKATIRNLTAQVGYYTYITRVYLPQVRAAVYPLLPKYTRDCKGGKKGELSKRSWRPSLSKEGMAGATVFTKPTGGWEVASESAIKAAILSELGIQHAKELLPRKVREKWGASLEITFSKKKCAQIAADMEAKKEYLSGMRKLATLEVGKIGIGSADARTMFNFDKEVFKPIRSAMKKLSDVIAGRIYDPTVPEEDEDEEEDAA